LSRFTLSAFDTGRIWRLWRGSRLAAGERGLEFAGEPHGEEPLLRIGWFDVRGLTLLRECEERVDETRRGAGFGQHQSCEVGRRAAGESSGEVEFDAREVAGGRVGAVEVFVADGERRWQFEGRVHRDRVRDDLMGIEGIAPCRDELVEV
jgi:hypothetical protein